MQLVIDCHGTVRGVYSEAIDLAQLGELAIRRASHVEPDASGHWWADLAPVGGPKLGPFDRRSEALAAESKWLEDHWSGEHIRDHTLGPSASGGGSDILSLSTTPKPEDRPWD
jgi:hypothetical protein